MKTQVRFGFPRNKRGALRRGEAPLSEPHGTLKDGTPFWLFRWQGNSLRKYWALSFDTEGEEITATVAQWFPADLLNSSAWEYADDKAKLRTWANAQESLAAMGWKSIADLEHQLCLRPGGRP